MEKFINGANRKNTSCIKWDLQKERIGKDNLLPFWIADSDYQTCEEVKKDLIERVSQGVFGYTICDDEYYQICINWFNKRYQYKIEKEWIIPTPGVVCSLYFLVQQFTEVFDSVLVSTPVYNPFFNVVIDNNRKLVCNKLVEVESSTFRSYKIDFVDLEEKLKDAKMYILCNPHNPVGRVWTKEELDIVVKLCKKYNVILVSDEIHCDIILKDYSFYSLGHYFDEYENICLCTAPSKTFNTAGLMTSNVIIKNKALQQKYRMHFEKMSLREPNLLGICACKSAYSKGEKWVDQQQIYLTENRDIVYNFFQKRIKQIKPFILEGTYLLWIDLRFLGLTQDEIFNGLVDIGILINNGTVYSKDHEGYIRFNIACGRKQLYEGLELLAKFVEKTLEEK